jgi:dihydrolipoamide dehydrogenase
VEARTAGIDVYSSVIKRGISMYDVAVIGGGPGGYTAAICSSQHGLKTALVEKNALGGTCLNRGCIPTKCFVQDTKLLNAARNSQVIKGNEGLSLDVTKMVARKRQVVKTVVGGLTAFIKSHGIDVLQGVGELIRPGRFKVSRSEGSAAEYDARHIILATGSKAALLPSIKMDGQLVQTTDEALDDENIPKRIVIIGGGVIGVEMASIYLNLGCDVTIIEMLPHILATEDEEIRHIMKALMEKRGAKIHLSAKATEVKIIGGEVELVLQDASGKVSFLRTDRVLVAAGRMPVTEGILINELGFKMEGPFLKVNSYLETSLPRVYAIGDLVGGMMLAHKAAAEAEAVVANILGGRKLLEPRRIPRCIWGVTEIAAVGLSERETKATGRHIRVGKYPYAYSGAANTIGKTDGLVKVIGDRETGEILGVHIIGECATELIGESVMAMAMESAVEDLAGAVKPHPTLSESVMEAAKDWSGLAVHAPKKRKNYFEPGVRI